jgi:predicted glycogen debranching enzyme
MKVNISLPKMYLRLHDSQNVYNSLHKEWIISNGIGGYASSSILGINTRKYHGLLLAALNPPVDRRVLLSKIDEDLIIKGEHYLLGSNEFNNDIHPTKCPYLSHFIMNPYPTYSFTIHNLQLNKTIFMSHKQNMTIIKYTIVNPFKEKGIIQLTPLINSRHFHSVTKKESLNWNFIQKPFDHGVTLETSIPLSSLLLYSRKGHYSIDEGKWIKGIYFREDANRGESCLDDQFQPGSFQIELDQEETQQFQLMAIAGKNEKETRDIFTTLQSKDLAQLNNLYHSEEKRQKSVLQKFQQKHQNVQMDDWLKWLILAADSFIVKRQSTNTKSVIAGYHWFEDWGRDSLISLPGLTLVTGRYEDAKEILLTFKQYCKQGIIPNRFPDCVEDAPLYNTVDATLWYFNAVHHYLKYTNDFQFVKKELWALLKEILHHHIQGTLNGIHMDEDMLLTHGPQLTWMDVKIGNDFITPRDGKAVEIQALWYNALKIAGFLGTTFHEKEVSQQYHTLAQKAKQSFHELFWNHRKKCLFDVVGEQQRDTSLRPNQIIAVMLDYPILDNIKHANVVNEVWKHLWSVYGLKTLAKDEPNYIGVYQNDRSHRDYAYHNGTVWAWLLGPFVTAFLKVKKYQPSWRKFAFDTFLTPLFLEEIFQAGLGTISEIFDGDPPHASRGCIAQAWSVAEPLRVYMEDVLMQRPPYEQLLKQSSSNM